MGTLLDKPMTVKETEGGEENDLIFGVSAMQGWRVDMVRFSFLRCVMSCELSRTNS